MCTKANTIVHLISNYCYWKRFCWCQLTRRDTKYPERGHHCWRCCFHRRLVWNLGFRCWLWQSVFRATVASRSSIWTNPHDSDSSPKWCWLECNLTIIRPELATKVYARKGKVHLLFWKRLRVAAFNDHLEFIKVLVKPRFNLAFPLPGEELRNYSHRS